MATSGVPQGSHLGPLLFTIFLNDIVDNLNADCLIFADDINIFTSVSTVQDCSRLQQCLSAIEAWCEHSRMKINAQKCHVISFHCSPRFIHFDYTLDSSTIGRVESINDLGVTLTFNLPPESHVNSIVSKANKVLGLLIRSARSGLSIEALWLIYITLVRSILEYCSVTWCPYQSGHIQHLERVKESFLRVIGLKLGYEYNSTPLAHVREVLGLQTLATRRQLLDLAFLQRILLGDINCPELLSLIDLLVGDRTRSSHLFAHHSHATNYEMNSAIPRLHRLVNLISPHDDFFFDSSRHLRRTVFTLL